MTLCAPAIGRLAALALAAALVAACSRGSEATPEQLSLACQVVECECADETISLFARPREAEIVWDARGRASCPEGFRLRRVERDVLGNRKK